MLRRFVGPALVTGALLCAPSAAHANHHACPQVTTIPNGMAPRRSTSRARTARRHTCRIRSAVPSRRSISGANQTVPLYLPGIQTPLLPDLGQWGDIITPAYSDPLNDAGPDLSCLKPNLGQPQGGDPPIPSPGSANDPFPIEYVLRNGNLQLGDGREVAIASVCAPTEGPQRRQQGLPVRRREHQDAGLVVGGPGQLAARC